MGIIMVWFMRHGKKEKTDHDNAKLTEQGTKDVKKSAEKNLVGVKFERMFCSLRNRTRETAEIVARVTGNNDVRIESKNGFDFAGAPNLNNISDCVTEIEKLSKDRKKQVTIALWRKVAPEMMEFFRRNVTEEIIRIANKIGGGEKYNIFVSSHGLIIEAISPVDLPIIQEADIVRYVVEVDGCKIKVLSSEYIPG